jgi:putative iron-regulated protein
MRRLLYDFIGLNAAWLLASALPASALAQSPAAPAPIHAAAVTAVVPGAVDRFEADASRQLESYGELAYRTYSDAHRTGLALQRAIDRLITRPDAAALAVARKAWLAARPSYGKSEAFRFYGGPIDAGKQDDFGHGPAGLEGLLNAWPLNEAVIDYVHADPKAGIIQGDGPITREALVSKNARDDEADVTTGYHAIEFLLWGQDESADGPGARKASDFTGEGVPARRRAYLKVVIDLLVDDLETLVNAWRPGHQNYRALLRQMKPGTGVRNILTGIATLSGFELASERLATALDSGSQEDEQSCFSDSNYADIVANAVGIENVYFARYGLWHGAGINLLVRAANPDLNRYLEQRIHATVALAQQLDQPFDRTLASPPGSPSRAKVEALVKAFQMQADLFKQAASALGVPIALGDAD